MRSENASPSTQVVDATTGHPLVGVASPELAAAAAAEDGLLFACEGADGTWLHVDADPRVLAAHRRAGDEVRLVAVVSACAARSAS